MGYSMALNIKGHIIIATMAVCRSCILTIHTAATLKCRRHKT